MKKKPFWQSSNFWHNLLTFIGSIWATSEAQQVIEGAGGLVDAIFAEEFQIVAIITVGFTLLNMIYQLFIKPRGDKTGLIVDAVVSKLEKRGVLPPPAQS